MNPEQKKVIIYESPDKGKTVKARKTYINQVPDVRKMVYTEEHMRMAFEYGKSLEPFDCFEDFIQSLK